MAQALEEILQLLLAATTPSDLCGPRKAIGHYIPVLEQLRARLEALPAMPDPSDAAVPSRQDVIEQYRAMVQEHWDDPRARRWIPALNRSRQAAQGVSSPHPDLPNQVRTPGYRLVLDIPASESTTTIIGRNLLNGTSNSADFAQAAADAVKAIMSLRRLDDVLMRVMAASDAADATEVSMARVMAMYRAEGNLGVPVSEESLDMVLPTAESAEGTCINLRPNLSHLVMLIRADASPGFPLGDSWPIQMLTFWMIQIAGLDIYAKYIDVETGNFITRDNFIEKSSFNWLSAGLPNSSTVDAASRWDALLAAMAIWQLDFEGETVMVGACNDPVALTSLILQEAIAHHEALASFGDRTLSPALAYLRYNQTDKFEAYLMLAAIAALKLPRDGRFGSLRSELRNDAALARDLTSLYDQIRPLNTRQSVAALEPTWPRFLDWLNAPAADPAQDRFLLVTDFLERATPKEWAKWQQGRGNLARYNHLLTYYESLFA